MNKFNKGDKVILVNDPDTSGTVQAVEIAYVVYWDNGSQIYLVHEGALRKANDER